MNTYKNKRKIVVRFAPSPTGTVHLGTARTALFNFLFARKYGGKYILRIEDTDVERSKKEFENNIFETISWLGLNADELYRQSERMNIYKKYLKQLVACDLAYISKEDQSLKKNKRTEVIRFRNPCKMIIFKDEIRGNVQYDTGELGNFVIAKSFDEPLYNFAVVVDDFEMGVTHVIRGEDHIPNTPRQILIQEAIGAQTPKYFHLPLILGKDRSKLSKRHGALPVLEYRNAGYLPSAILNYLSLLGWSPGNDQEIFTLDKLIKYFDTKGLQKSPAVFNEEKIDWLNRKHIALLSNEDLGRFLTKFLPKNFYEQSPDLLKRLLPFIRERITKFGDIHNNYAEEWQYFFEHPKYSPQNLICPPRLQKNESVNLLQTQEHLVFIKKRLSTLTEKKFTQENIKNLMWDYADTHGRGAVLWPMRYALSGKEKSLDLFNLASVLGKKETMERISSAIEGLSGLISAL